MRFLNSVFPMSQSIGSVVRTKISQAGLRPNLDFHIYLCLLNSDKTLIAQLKEQQGFEAQGTGSKPTFTNKVYFNITTLKVFSTSVKIVSVGFLNSR